jgi:hypothetical protein
MLVLNRLLLNREYVVINALKTLASIISMCDLHVSFLSNITPRYFTLFTNEPSIYVGPNLLIYALFHK